MAVYLYCFRGSLHGILWFSAAQTLNNSNWVGTDAFGDEVHSYWTTNVVTWSWEWVKLPYRFAHWGTSSRKCSTAIFKCQLPLRNSSSLLPCKVTEPGRCSERTNHNPWRWCHVLSTWRAVRTFWRFASVFLKVLRWLSGYAFIATQKHKPGLLV